VAETAVAELPLFPFTTPNRTPFTPVPDIEQDPPAGPVTRVRLATGGWAWLVTRHADVRQMLRHPAFSADVRRPGFPLFRPLPPQNDDERRGGFIRMDGVEHARLRKMLTAEFMIKRVQRLEPVIRQTVTEFLDAMRDAGPPADLIRSFALPVPSMVICHLLGVPYADHDFFQVRSRMLLDRSVDPAGVRTAVDELRAYLGRLVEAKLAADDRGEDLLGRLVTERVDTGELEPDELVGMGLLLLIAGHETTANMIGLSTLLLLQHPEHLAALRADPGRAPDLVEELLRYLTIVRTGLPRAAIEDVHLGGQPIRAGEGAIALLPMANWDEAVFDRADEFDPYREAHQHFAFGFGVHQCIGQPLARAELRIALVELARRFPGLRALTTPEEVPTRDTSIVYGLAELPVTW
jgi:cytochrome P450